MIVLLGATGFTGSLCAKELSRLGLPARLVARDRAKLDALVAELGGTWDTAIASPDRPETLAAALVGAKVVINTVGPFTELGEPAVQAALAVGAHYLDTTGEQAYMAQILDRYDAEAQKKGVAVICAHAFEYAVGDAAAALVVEALGGHAEHIDVVYTSRGGGLSRGTAKSAFRALAEPIRGWNKGKTAVLPTPGRQAMPSGKVISVVSFGGGEMLHIPRHLSVDSLQCWLSLPPATAKWLGRLGRVRGLTRNHLVRGLADRLIDRQAVPEVSKREASTFNVFARGRNAGKTRTIAIEGHDPYALTAQIAVDGAKRLLSAPPRQVGVISSTMAFDVHSFVAGLSVQVHDS